MDNDASNIVNDTEEADIMAVPKPEAGEGQGRNL